MTVLQHVGQVLTTDRPEPLRAGRLSEVVQGERIPGEKLGSESGVDAYTLAFVRGACLTLDQQFACKILCRREQVRCAHFNIVTAVLGFAVPAGYTHTLAKGAARRLPAKDNISSPS
jgi:hypothetical protein